MTAISPAPRYLAIAPPPLGEAVEVAPDVLWVRMPLPFRPSHVNCWLLGSETGWTLVDTGISDETTREAWRAVFASALRGRPIERVLCTHHHTDHIGLAAELCREWDASLLMSRTEWLIGRLLPLQWQDAVPQTLLSWDSKIGLPRSITAEFWQMRVQRCHEQSLPLPESFIEVKDGDELPFRNDRCIVKIGTGHSPAPVLLHLPERNMLISGDQILPRITPHVGVDYMEPRANPLGAYLCWLDRVATLPASTIVLPSHGEPFEGLRERVAHVRAWHRQGMERLTQACRETGDVQPLVRSLFEREVDIGTLAFATQECLAHLQLLASEGVLAREERRERLLFRMPLPGERP